MLSEEDLTQRRILERIEYSIRVNWSRLEQATLCSEIAWLTRNLLELLIWAEYCRRDKLKAKKFADDGKRDVFESLKSFKSININVNASKARREMIEASRADGFNIEAPFTQVSEAARTLGHADFFVDVNKRLSKFAHPTSLAIIIAGTDNEIPLIGNFKIIGDVFAKAGLMFANLDGPLSDPYLYIKRAIT